MRYKSIRHHQYLTHQCGVIIYTYILANSYSTHQMCLRYHGIKQCWLLNSSSTTCWSRQVEMTTAIRCGRCGKWEGRLLLLYVVVEVGVVVSTDLHGLYPVPYGRRVHVHGQVLHGDEWHLKGSRWSDSLGRVKRQHSRQKRYELHSIQGGQYRLLVVHCRGWRWGDLG